MIANWPELLVAILACMVMRESITWLRARQGFPVLMLPNRFLGAGRFVLAVACLIFVMVVLATTDRLHWAIRVGGILGGLYLFHFNVFQRLQFREHGLVYGPSFILYQSISEFLWQDQEDRNPILVLRGAWIIPKKAEILDQHRGLVDGILKGAARLEATSPARLVLLSFHRFAMCLLLTGIIWFALCRIP